MQQTVGTEPVPRNRKLPLRPVGRETVQDRVYRQMKELILNGEIEPGQTITIQRLSDAFQVSAMPVREALRRLMAEQALMVVSGRSVGIPTLTHARLADLRRVRREVEGLAAAWAAERVSAVDLRRLAELLDRMQLAANARDGGRYVPANRQFHFTIYRAAGSDALLSIIESLWLQIGPHSHVLRASDNWERRQLRPSRNAGGAQAARRQGSGRGTPTRHRRSRNDIKGAARLMPQQNP